MNSTTKDKDQDKKDQIFCAILYDFMQNNDARCLDSIR